MKKKKLQAAMMGLVLTLMLMPVPNAKSTPVTFQPASASQTNIETLTSSTWADLKMKISLLTLQAINTAPNTSTSQTNTVTSTPITWADRKAQLARISQANFSDQSSPTADRTQINTVNINTQTLQNLEAGMPSINGASNEDFGAANVIARFSQGVNHDTLNSGTLQILGVDTEVAKHVATPEPSSLLLLASGLMGFYALFNLGLKQRR